MAESLDVLYSRVLAEVSDRSTSTERCVELMWELYDAVPADEDGAKLYDFVVKWALTFRPDYDDIIEARPARRKNSGKVSKSLTNVTRRNQRAARRSQRTR